MTQLTRDDEVTYNAAMDTVFKALSDPTRRGILDSLRGKDGQTLTELEGQLEMTRFAVMKHLKVLEAASLVVSRRSGRFKHHYLNAVPLQEALDRWIEPYRAAPIARFALDLKETLEMETAALAETDVLPDLVLETYIRTTPERLWKALTDPEQIARYHFKGAVQDRPLAEKGDHVVLTFPSGQPMLAHDVIASDPPRLLEMTFNSLWAPEAPVSTMRYEIEAVGDMCKLTLLHRGIPAAHPGIKDGWARHLSSLKSYLETGERLTFAD